MVKCCRATQLRRPRCSDLDLTHDDLSAFLKSQISCKGSEVLTITWNGVWCIFLISVLFVDVFRYWESDRCLWLVPLQNWAFLLCAATTAWETVSRIHLIMLDRNQSETSEGLRWLQKVQWVFYNTNNVTTIVSIIIYFSLYKIGLTFGAITKHLLTSVYVILNTSVISAIPCKLLHFYQPIIFFVIYAVFTAIWQSQIQTHVLLVFDWTTPETTAVVLVCSVLAGTPLLHILFYGIFRLRFRLCKKCFRSKDLLGSPPATIERDITATDVVLEHPDGPGVAFIDIKPDCKDDISVKPGSSANGDVFNRYNMRLFKSETDLREYRTKNGLYCDFAKSSLTVHPKRKSASDIFDDDTPNLGNNIDRTSKSRGSQIIMVKKCKTCENNNEESDSDSSSSHTECESNASSDFLSQYITEDILAYL